MDNQINPYEPPREHSNSTMQREEPSKGILLLAALVPFIVAIINAAYWTMKQ